MNKTRIMHSMHSGQIVHIDSGHFDIDLMKLKDFLIQNWLNTALVLLLIYVAFTKDIHFAVHLNDDTPQLASNISQSQKPRSTKQKVANQGLVAASMIGSMEENDHNGDGIVELLPARPLKAVKPVAQTAQGNEANLFDNVSIFVNPQKSDPSVLKSKQEKCWDYVTRFINIARTERKKFGIPVSITLAQGLLESDAGQSRLTTKANNHFGIKTFNKKVAHVVMKDDTPKDKFKIYSSAWESYRDHSLLLMRDHYKHLQFLSKTDYAGWAKGLEKAGYATDRQYAENLIRIIENLQLYRFDEA
jgi:flagellum-specific peptidoglycan hydrolase FlgJ